MAVEFRVTNVKNYDEKFPSRVDEDGQEHWNNVTMSIMWAMLPLAQWNITEKNWEDMFRLIHLYERLNGAFQYKFIETADGKHIRRDVYITAQNVYDHIGFSVNGGTETVAKAKNRTVANFFKFDCNDLIRAVKKDEVADVV